MSSPTKAAATSPSTHLIAPTAAARAPGFRSPIRYFDHEREFLPLGGRVLTCENGAPRRNRTYNPLAGSRVIGSALSSASALVSGGVPGVRASLMLGQSASDFNVSVDQSGRSITRTRDIDDVKADAGRLALEHEEFPSQGAAHTGLAQDLAQPFSTDHDAALVAASEVGGEFAGQASGLDERGKVGLRLTCRPHGGALPVNSDDRLVPHDPRVVSSTRRGLGPSASAAAGRRHCSPLGAVVVLPFGLRVVRDRQPRRGLRRYPAQWCVPRFSGHAGAVEYCRRARSGGRGGNSGGTRYDSDLDGHRTWSRWPGPTCVWRRTARSGHRWQRHRNTT
jgi:hypothetical protein